MNRRKFFKIMAMVTSLPILNKLLGTQSKYLPAPVMDLECIDKNPGIRAYGGGLRIVDYDPTTRTTSVDWTSPPSPKDGFIDGMPNNPVHTWPEALALSQKMNL